MPLQTVKRQRTHDTVSTAAATTTTATAASKPIWAHPQREMRGHTSYLTFATLLPTDVPAQPAAGRNEAPRETPSESETAPV